MARDNSATSMAGKSPRRTFSSGKSDIMTLRSALIQFTGGDKIRLYEEWVAELKQIERTAEDSYRSGQVQQTDVDIVHYYRLEAKHGARD